MRAVTLCFALVLTVAACKENVSEVDRIFSNYLRSYESSVERLKSRHAEGTISDYDYHDDLLNKKSSLLDRMEQINQSDISDKSRKAWADLLSSLDAEIKRTRSRLPDNLFGVGKIVSGIDFGSLRAAEAQYFIAQPHHSEKDKIVKIFSTSGLASCFELRRLAKSPFFASEGKAEFLAKFERALKKSEAELAAREKQKKLWKRTGRQPVYSMNFDLSIGEYDLEQQVFPVLHVRPQLRGRPVFVDDLDGYTFSSVRRIKACKDLPAAAGRVLDLPTSETKIQREINLPNVLSILKEPVSVPQSVARWAVVENSLYQETSDRALFAVVYLVPSGPPVVEGSLGSGILKSQSTLEVIAIDYYYYNDLVQEVRANSQNRAYSRTRGFVDDVVNIFGKRTDRGVGAKSEIGLTFNPRDFHFFRGMPVGLPPIAVKRLGKAAH